LVLSRAESSKAKDESAVNQALSARPEKSETRKAIEAAAKDVLVNMGVKVNAATKGAMIIPSANRIKQQLNDGVIDQTLFTKAMKDLNKEWDALGLDISFDDAQKQLLNPALNYQTPVKR
jgi:hypothetical protein